MSIIFPKPLPPIKNVSDPDQTGLTESEKVTLRNIWRVIKRHLRKHARNIFIEFYTEHAEMLDYFRGPEDKFYMHSLHMHSEVILQIYDRLIEEGLNNYAMFHIILSDVVAKHSCATTLQKDGNKAIAKQIKACQDYFASVIKSVSTPTALAALQKLSDVIIYNII